MNDLLTRNLGLKLVSVLIAVTVWYKVSFLNPAGITMTYYRSITVVNKDPSLVVTHSYEGRSVELILTGRRLDLLQAESQLGAKLDLKNVKSPIGEVSLQVEAVIPQGADLKARVRPSVIRVVVNAAPAPHPPLPSASPLPGAGIAAHGAKR